MQDIWKCISFTHPARIIQREEILRLRSNKPSAGEHLDVPTEENVDDNTTTAIAALSDTSVDQANKPSRALSADVNDNDDDSEKPTGLEDASKHDQDLMLEDDTSIDTANSLYDATPLASASPLQTDPVAPETMTEMFQRILNLNPGADSGQVAVQLGGTASPGVDVPANASTATDPSEFCASMVRNGRLICNLPDHPIHAGATAVVTVILGKQLTVANAGDSRAILCRSGVAYALTSDHKPLQDRELTRIRNAGGFVNHFGRVNGNLNLSRSIGDLKYKQVPGLTPAEQMITAEPDIVQ